MNSEIGYAITNSSRSLEFGFPTELQLEGPDQELGSFETYGDYLERLAATMSAGADRDPDSQDKE